MERLENIKGQVQGNLSEEQARVPLVSIAVAKHSTEYWSKAENRRKWDEAVRSATTADSQGTASRKGGLAAVQSSADCCGEDGGTWYGEIWDCWKERNYADFKGAVGGAIAGTAFGGQALKGAGLGAVATSTDEAIDQARCIAW